MSSDNDSAGGACSAQANRLRYLSLESVPVPLSLSPGLGASRTCVVVVRPRTVHASSSHVRVVVDYAVRATATLSTPAENPRFVSFSVVR